MFRNIGRGDRFFGNLYGEKRTRGNPNAEWLQEYIKVFETKIPHVNESDIILDIMKVIIKKRNWSSPGHDYTVNFCLKRLFSIHEPMQNIFMGIINSLCEMASWCCGGRTSFLEKPGLWQFDNIRPIPCTNNTYKGFTSVLQNIFNAHKNKYGTMQMAHKNKYGTMQMAHKNKYGTMQMAHKNKYGTMQMAHKNKYDTMQMAHKNKYGTMQMAHKNKYGMLIRTSMVPCS